MLTAAQDLCSSLKNAGRRGGQVVTFVPFSPGARRRAPGCLLPAPRTANWGILWRIEKSRI
jgi:hypothetical protein